MYVLGYTVATLKGRDSMNRFFCLFFFVCLSKTELANTSIPAPDPSKPGVWTNFCVIIEFPFPVNLSELQLKLAFWLALAESRQALGSLSSVVVFWYLFKVF